MELITSRSSDWINIFYTSARINEFPWTKLRFINSTHIHHLFNSKLNGYFSSEAIFQTKVLFIRIFAPRYTEIFISFLLFSNNLDFFYFDILHIRFTRTSEHLPRYVYHLACLWTIKRCRFLDIFFHLKCNRNKVRA